MKYKHIVFDIDGTLIDTEKAILNSLQDTIIELQNRKIDLVELRFALGIPGETTLQQLGINDIQQGNKTWNNHLKKHIHSIKVFDGIEPLIKNLKEKQYTLGIITSKNRNEYKNDFEPFALEKYFKKVICVEDSEQPKPSPEPMMKYIEVTKAKKAEVLYIGDSIYDMQCALNAGVDFGLALWGRQSAGQIQATYYFDTPQDIALVC
ncbi:HAD family hydrolase [uncultured Bacteroides sp.]|uniref:HAD family hydrolase n=1 Tax=uncultured Bacteroides sp. TaxID=162156 RepID=UPI002AA82FAF|nr:HAD family hydrolase [uncultured Bacteroides sp.]